MAGPGSFGRQEDCSMRGVGGSGLNWFTAQEFGSYSLKLDWKLVKDDNSGIFVGFPNPATTATSRSTRATRSRSTSPTCPIA